MIYREIVRGSVQGIFPEIFRASERGGFDAWGTDLRGSDGVVGGRI